MKINDIVQTPNGPARLVSTYYLGHEGPEDPPEGVLVKHKLGQEIDRSLCAWTPPGATGETSGMLAVYKLEEIA